MSCHCEVAALRYMRTATGAGEGVQLVSVNLRRGERLVSAPRQQDRHEQFTIRFLRSFERHNSFATILAQFTQVSEPIHEMVIKTAIARTQDCRDMTSGTIPWSPLQTLIEKPELVRR